MVDPITAMEVGNRFIHSVIDHRSKHSAKETFVTYHESSSLEVLTTVDYETLGRAVDRTAFWLRDLLRDETSKTICYISPSDIRYLLILFGSSKNGSKVISFSISSFQQKAFVDVLQALFSSPRNSVEAHLSLMEKSGCSILVGDSKRIPKAVLETKTFVEMKPLSHWLDASDVPPFRCEKTYGEAANDILLYLHSSGSTGLPKLIQLPHSWFAAQDAYSLIPREAGRKTIPDHMAGARFFLAAPFFHVPMPLFRCRSTSNIDRPQQFAWFLSQ
jgi:acyl-CoA synthetase (AMP-forming)/AMP-acid ligase II